MCTIEWFLAAVTPSSVAVASAPLTSASVLVHPEQLASITTPKEHALTPVHACSCSPWTQIGLKVASLQEQSTANRKALADATREFKRSSSAATSAAECSTAAGNLLRQYQDEIDTLTRRAKHGEGAFLDLYEQLIEVRALVKCARRMTPQHGKLRSLLVMGRWGVLRPWSITAVPVGRISSSATAVLCDNWSVWSATAAAGWLARRVLHRQPDQRVPTVSKQAAFAHLSASVSP
eukprot:GHRQ01021861.1.p1 GENE.GHRQ01021861.1~~GHRQ01021861.1.p1  ORF type:complete len:235 (-),score=48.98 GHRQ01021861.1:692-1396(-)